MKLVAAFYKLELAQFIELQSFSQFVADLGQETKDRLTKGRRLVEMLRLQIGILSLAAVDIIRRLAINKVQSFVRIYLSVPVWAYFFVPVRLVGASCLRLV